jgi:hypothetical protein
MGIVIPFHRQDFGRLIFKRIETVCVAGRDLQRRHESGHPHRHRKHYAGARVLLVAQQMPGAYRADDESGRQIGRQDHMDQPVGKGRIEDGGPPAGHHELPDRVHRIAGGRLHPAIDRENPKGGKESAESDHERREEMKFWSNALASKQHDAEKTGFEKEG